MRIRLPLAACLAAAALVGCGAPEGSGEGAAFVFFDAPARNAGLALVAGKEVLAARGVPLELDAPVAASLQRLPDGRALRHGEEPPPAARLAHVAELDLHPDEAVHVRGSDGAVMRGPADADRVYLVGPEKAAQDVAARFGSWPTRLEGSEDAPSLGRAERWVLVAPDVLSLMATLEPRELADLEAVVPAYLAGDAADDQEAELERAGDEEAVARSEARAIERDLAVLVTLADAQRPGGVPTFDVGESIPLRATLSNQSQRARAVVWPGDGSSVGWREPYVRWTVERENAPGVWEKLPDAPYGRCGNYDSLWQKDAALLGPGESRVLTDMIEPTGVVDLSQPGRYRARAHYLYRGGAGSGAFGDLSASVHGAPAPQARLLEGVPAFEVISAPFELRIVRCLGLEMSARGAALDTASPDSVEVWLVNRAREPRAVEAGSITGFTVEVTPDGAERAPSRPRSQQAFSLLDVRIAPQVLAPGARVRLPLVVEPHWAEYRLGSMLPDAGVVTARGWLWQGSGDARTAQMLHGNHPRMTIRSR